MAINSLKNPLVIKNNEHPKRLKKGGSVKGYAEGGMLLEEETVAPQDPLTKGITPVIVPKAKAPTVVTKPSSAYDEAGYEKFMSTKSNVIDPKTGKVKAYAFPLEQERTDPKTGAKLPRNIMVPKELNTWLPALTTRVKEKQAILTATQKKLNKGTLSKEDSDKALAEKGLGTYDQYIRDFNNLGNYRKLTVVQPEELTQEVGISTTTQSAGQGGGYYMEPNFPYDSTHAQKIFPQGIYDKKQKAGGIKGYIEGGNIQKQSVRDTKSKVYSTDPEDYIADTGLAIVDWSLQGIGLQDVIKAEDYSTKAGEDTNRLNSGVGAVGSAVGGAVLDYYVPGAGTAVNAGKAELGSMAGEDEGISDADKQTMASIGALGQTASSITSSMGSGNTSIPSTTSLSTLDKKESTIPEQGTQYPETMEMKKVPATGAEGLTGQALLDYKQASPEGQADVLKKYNEGGYAKGGTISPNKAAKILHDGTIRGHKITDQQRKFFGAMMNKKADGGDIKKIVNPDSTSSYNSYMNYKNNKAYHRGQFEDILNEKDQAKREGLMSGYEKASADEEAQNAKKKLGIKVYPFQKKADGGKIVGAGTGKSDSIPAKLEDDGFVVPAVNAKKAEELRAKYLGEPKGKIASLNKGGVPVKVSNGEHYFTKAEKEMLMAKGVDLDALAPNADVSADGKADGGDIDKKRKDAEKNYMIYVNREKAIKANPDKFTEAEKAESKKNLNKFYKEYQAIPKKQTALEKMEAQVAEKDRAIQEKRKTRTPEETANLAGVKKGATTTKASPKGVAGVGMATIDTTPRTPSEEEMNLQQAELAGMESATPVTQVVQTPAEKELEASAMQGIATSTTPATEKKKFNPFEKVDIGKGLAVAQTGLGIQQLLQDGERPVDVIDPEFAGTVSDAQAAAQYGMSPLELAIANRGIEKNRAADTQTIINLSGGSAGTALANIRAASISANEAKTNLSAQSEALRLQKKRYADAKIAEKAGMSKQLFAEKLDAFNVDQQAGANLLGAGIQNLVGSSRLDRELEAQKKRENMYNQPLSV